jgi:hypothetical protein
LALLSCAADGEQCPKHANAAEPEREPQLGICDAITAMAWPARERHSLSASEGAFHPPRAQREPG